MAETSQFRLLRERRFAPFFGVQFLGALNDNVFKQALVILLAYQTVSFTSLSTDVLQNLAQALFVLPFFLFSATAGQLADKYEKSRLIRVTVLIELAVMALGAAGFFCTAWNCCSWRCFSVGCNPPCSDRSSMRSCPSSSGTANWWAATRWSKPGPRSRSCSA
jgi:MFS family permease